MGYIRISAITWVTPPSSAKVSTIKHRLTSDPDVPGSYTTDSTTTSIEVSGDIIPDVDILGLADETSYTVKINSNCGGASATQVFTTGIVCPDVSGIAGTGNAGAP